jgi:hypothetical protein
VNSNTDVRAAAPRAVSRRAVTAGAAWVTPLIVVGVAAPAFAASCVGAFRLNWGTTAYSPVKPATGPHVGTATVTPTSGTAAPVVVTFSSTVNNTVTRDAANLTVPPDTNIGNLGAGERGLSISHASPITAGTTNRQIVTIGFSRAVVGLSFTITDIDSSSGNWYDRVELTGVRTATPATHVIGAGTAASPWQYDDNNTNVGITNGNGNVLVTYPAAVTSIQLDYWSTVSNGNQRIFLGDFTFTAAC